MTLMYDQVPRTRELIDGRVCDASLAVPTKTTAVNEFQEFGHSPKRKASQTNQANFVQYQFCYWH